WTTNSNVLIEILFDYFDFTQKISVVPMERLLHNCHLYI
ncbi:unnamed protein product, partial [Diabrotica balteata]